MTFRTMGTVHTVMFWSCETSMPAAAQRPWLLYIVCNLCRSEVPYML